MMILLLWWKHSLLAFFSLHLSILWCEGTQANSKRPLQVWICKPQLQASSSSFRSLLQYRSVFAVYSFRVDQHQYNIRLLLWWKHSLLAFFSLHLSILWCEGTKANSKRPLQVWTCKLQLVVVVIVIVIVIVNSNIKFQYLWQCSLLGHCLPITRAMQAKTPGSGSSDSAVYKL